MNIALLTEMMNVGGASTLVLRQARWLREHGHGVVVISAGGALLQELLDSGIPHVTMTSFEPGKQFGPEQLVREGALLQRTISEHRLDAIIAQAQWPFPFAVAAAAGTIPVFLDLLSPVYWVPKTPDGVAAVQSAAHDGRILATAVVAAQSFGGAYDFDPRLAHVTNVPIAGPQAPVRTRESVRSSLGIAPDEFVVITVARLDADRAPMILPLARAVEKLSSPQRRLRLLVVGDGTQAAALRAQAPPTSIFTGFRRDLADLYAAADLFAGEGSVVQDAAAAGLPAIVTCATVYPQQAHCAFSIFGLHLAEHFFVAPSSIVSPVPIEQALQLLLDNPQYRSQIVAAGKACFEKHWSMDSVMSRRLAIVQDRHKREAAIGACEAAIEIDGGLADDVEYVAQALALTRSPERFGVAAAQPVPWSRFFSMPLENVQALCSAAWRLSYPAPAFYRLRGRELSGELSPSHADFARMLHEMPPPAQDARDAFDFGTGPERTTLLVVPVSDMESAIAYVSRLPQTQSVVAWEPDVEEGDRRFPEAWERYTAASGDARSIVNLQGALPWALFSRVARATSCYVDDGSDRWHDRRELARTLGLRVERFS